MRLFPLALLSSQSPQAQHSASLCSRTLGTQRLKPTLAGPATLSLPAPSPCRCPSNSLGPRRTHHVAGKQDPSYTFCGWLPAHPLPTQSLSYIKKKKSFPPLTIERNKWLTNNNSRSSPTKARNYYNYTILD